MNEESHLPPQEPAGLACAGPGAGGVAHFPADPIAAASHSDPYPYYAALAARRPFHYHPALALWVASSAAAVAEVLSSELCRVRPAAQPVPPALAGGPAGDVFARMIRMNDGGLHRALKPVIAGLLVSADIGNAAAHCAGSLARTLGPRSASSAITDFVFQLPAHAVARLLGIGEPAPPALALWARDFARCLGPAPGAALLERGHAACSRLRDLLASSKGGLVEALLSAAARAGFNDDEAIIANAIALFFQSHDATAGLIGNTLLALSDHPSADVSLAVAETLRWNAPIQNTRRFVVRDGTLAGQAVREGEVILVLLGAANRDPAANPDPDRFDPLRREPRVFSFGAGLHACPGRAQAAAIAAAGIRQLIEASVDPAVLAADFAWMPSANARVPLFGGTSRYQ